MCGGVVVWEVLMELRGRGSTRPTTGADAVEVMNLAVCCDSHAPRLARNAFDLVEGIDGVRDDVRLVVSELVSNAVKLAEVRGFRYLEVDASSESRPILVEDHKARPQKHGLNHPSALSSVG